MEQFIKRVVSQDSSVLQLDKFKSNLNVEALERGNEPLSIPVNFTQSGNDWNKWEKIDYDAELENADNDKDKDSEKGDVFIAEKITELKAKGNIEFQKKRYKAAKDIYSSALKLVKSNASSSDEIKDLLVQCFGNRAMCNLKLDLLKECEVDCDKALELDPTYVKAWVRRASAKKLAHKYQSSLQDYQHAERLLAIKGVDGEKDRASVLKEIEQLNLKIAEINSKKTKEKSEASSIKLHSEPAKITPISEKKTPKKIETVAEKTDIMKKLIVFEEPVSAPKSEETAVSTSDRVLLPKKFNVHSAFEFESAFQDAKKDHVYVYELLNSINPENLKSYASTCLDSEFLVVIFDAFSSLQDKWISSRDESIKVLEILSQISTMKRFFLTLSMLNDSDISKVKQIITSISNTFTDLLPRSNLLLSKYA